MAGIITFLCLEKRGPTQELGGLGSIPALPGEGIVARSDLAELTVLPEMTA
jgi:hypothetical protein